MSDVFGADSPLVTDLSGGVGPFYGPDKLYPGDVGAGYDPDAYFASKGYTKNPNTGKIIDISKYNVTGGEPTSSTAEQAAAPTGTDQVTVTGQRGTGISGVLPSAGVTAIDVIGQRPDDKEEETTFVDTAVNALSTVTGLPLGDIYEVVTTAERPKEVLDAALGALGITIPEFDFGTSGETFEVRPENLVPPYFDPKVTDGSGMNDNTTAAGTGGAFDIANLAAIRSAVPGTYDPNRRAGSGGQRYFSDVQYAPQGGIAGSQAAANTQAMLLAYQNATNPAYQVRPGNATDRATSMAQRAAGLAGL
ncbi:MAG: hypothetical protein IZT57_05455, partial [Chloroflexi bacterium]|nr:hypothetical protein [Chloroflexota bacterium]